MPRTNRVSGLRALIIGTSSLAAAAVLGLSSAHADPQVEPDEQEVTAQDVEDAFHAAEAANEEVNQLTEDQEELQRRIDELSGEISSVQSNYDEQRAGLEAAIVQQQMDTPLGPTASLIASKDAEVFLDGLSAVDALNTSRAEALDTFSNTNRDLKNRKAQLDVHRKKLDSAVAEAEEKKAEVEREYERAQAALEQLDDEQREEVDGGDNGGGQTEQPPPTDIPEASGKAQAAIDFALGQLGDPYVYGGTGPDSWDCSGLTQAAWGAAGVGLPRVVGPQINAGTRIPMSELQPGDLVAYSSMSHIGLYLGNGQVIHAPRPGKTVEIVGLSGFDVAARVG